MNLKDKSNYSSLKKCIFVCLLPGLFLVFTNRSAAMSRAARMYERLPSSTLVAGKGGVLAGSLFYDSFSIATNPMVMPRHEASFSTQGGFGEHDYTRGGISVNLGLLDVVYRYSNFHDGSILGEQDGKAHLFRSIELTPYFPLFGISYRRLSDHSESDNTSNLIDLGYFFDPERVRSFFYPEGAFERPWAPLVIPFSIKSIGSMAEEYRIGVAYGWNWPEGFEYPVNGMQKNGWPRIGVGFECVAYRAGGPSYGVALETKYCRAGIMASTQASPSWGFGLIWPKLCYSREHQNTFSRSLEYSIHKSNNNYEHMFSLSFHDKLFEGW